MVVWLRPEYILAIATSLYYCSELVLSKTYDKFWCATEEGYHQLSCPDETALLTDISIRKVYRRTQMCAPDDHSEYLAHCQSYIDGSLCEGNKTCSIEISSRDYIQCGDKSYAPTYFFVKYTCTQIYTMCTDTASIRNTLYGYIVSPAYPHPMADNLKCSLNIEVDSSMYIELSPIEIHLQEAIKCRSEYIEIFGYTSLSDDNNNLNKNTDNKWNAYYTWCGADRSLHNPIPNARYLISSNSLHMSLETAVSKKPRYFKIRYKVVPSAAKSQYDSDGVAYDVSNKESIPFMKTILSSTTIIIPSLNNSDVKNLNGTITKRTFKKKVLIGIIVGVAFLLIAITAGIITFIFLKRRRPSSNTGKKSAPTSTTTSATTSKPNAKSADKAPLLEQTTTVAAAAAAAAATKRKLVPERTVQISDTTPSRFKPNETKGQAGISSDTSSSKPVLTAADSGIYGADLFEESTSVPKTVSPPISDPPKANAIDLSNVPEPVTTIVVNLLTENETISAIVLPNIDETNSSATDENGVQTIVLIPVDDTIQSAYSNLIDATTSENEGAICSSTLQSRRTSSNRKQSLVNQESNNTIETIILSEQPETLLHNIIPFNPLHVILKKDASKYYTTEYI